MRKTTTLLTLSSSLLLGACASSPQLSSDAPVVYLNTHIGFSEDSYAYAQPQMMCEIDERLVVDIIDKAARQNIRVEPLSEPGDIQVSSNLLTIDIAQLGAKQSRAHLKNRVMSLRDLKRAAVRRSAKAMAIVLGEYCNEADVCFRARPLGPSARSALCVAASRQVQTCLRSFA